MVVPISSGNFVVGSKETVENDVDSLVTTLLLVEI